MTQDLAPAEINKIVAETFSSLKTMKDSGDLQLLVHWGLTMLSAIMILIAGRVIGNFLARRIQSVKRLDETLATFLATFIKYAVMAVAVVTILGQFGVQTASLLAVMGAAGLAIGLALQGTLSNVAAGVMLLILRPFKVGDTINVDSITGTVKTLGLFGTELSSADNVYIFAPNSMIWNNDITNYSRNPVRRQDINVRIAYESDVGKAFEIINDILAADPRILRDDDHAPAVMVDRMGDIATELIVRFWAVRADFGQLRFDITLRIKQELTAAGIIIPTLPVATPA